MSISSIMPLFDFMMMIVFFASLMNGYRRGIISDVLIFGLWVPVVFIAIHVLATQFNVNDMSLDPSARDLLSSVGTIYLVGQIVIWLVDKFMLRPAFASRGDSLQDWNRGLGAIFAVVRTFVVITALFMVFESQVKHMPPETFEGSVILTKIHEVAVDALLYGSERGWIDFEYVLYEAPVQHFEPKDDSIFGVLGL